MRIVGGEFGSRRLLAPEGLETRPTLDRVREAVFSALMGRIAGARVLDLFGGSGAYALEALSRGAEKCCVNDFSPKAIKVIRQNIASLRVEDRTTVLSLAYTQALTQLQTKGETFSLVFLDPPYRKGIIPQVLAELREKKLLTSEAVVVCETQADEELPLPVGFAEWKSKRYGTVKITYVVQEEPQ